MVRARRDARAQPAQVQRGQRNEEGRVEYERDWERRRQERKAKNEREQTEDKRQVTVGTEGVTIEGAGMPTEPRFVSEAYFMDFTFEPGNYFLAGRETLEGKSVIRIEYYPMRLFNDDDNEKKPREMTDVSKARQRDDKVRGDKSEEDMDRKMNKTALGAGAGIFFIAPLLKINIDVARGVQGDTRLHVGSGFSF